MLNLPIDQKVIVDSAHLWWNWFKIIVKNSNLTPQQQGVLPEKFDGCVGPTFQNPYPIYDPCDIPYPIYDLTKNSIPYLPGSGCSKPD